MLRPGGLLVATAIARFAALLDLLVRLDRLHDPATLAIAEDAVRTGVFRGAAGGMFTTAFFHTPAQLSHEIASAGFARPTVFNVEGPGFLVTNFADRWNNPAKREALLHTARLLESEPDMLAAASHLMAVTTAPAEDA